MAEVKLDFSVLDDCLVGDLTKLCLRILCGNRDGYVVALLVSENAVVLVRLRNRNNVEDTDSEFHIGADLTVNDNGTVG